VNYLLTHLENNFPKTIDKVDAPDTHHLPGWELITHTFLVDPALQHRRKILGGILKNECFSWAEIYRVKIS